MIFLTEDERTDILLDAMLQTEDNKTNLDYEYAILLERALVEKLFSKPKAWRYKVPYPREGMHYHDAQRDHLYSLDEHHNYVKGVPLFEKPEMK